VTAEPSFREATDSDLPILLPLLREYYAFDGHTFDDQQTPAALAALLRDPSLGRVWLIADGPTPVGYIALCFGYSLEWLGRDAFVDEFYLREDYRHRGWGRKTIAFVENAARSLHIRALHLEVARRNAPALQIYRKLGFREHLSTFMSKKIAPEPSRTSNSTREPAKTTR